MRTPWVHLVALGLAATGLARGEWFKGNTHAHTTRSDGNATPTAVAQWYRDHGYQFLFLTDHEVRGDVTGLNAEFTSGGRFLVLPGIEVTQHLGASRDPRNPAQRLPAHVNGLGIRTDVHALGWSAGQELGYAPSGMSMAETFARNIAAIRAAGGIAQVNHPNYLWSVRPEDLRGLPDDTLLEIWNGQPACHNLGGRDDAGREAPSAEALWDQILSTGKHVWGVASDDSHDYRNVGPQQASSPGQGWVVVRAEKLDPSAIVEALGRGSFYASTGIELGDYRVAGTEISLVIKAPPRSETRYVTCFIGSGGKLLKEVHGLRPRYRIRGHEGYVRARVTDSDGHQAWTQPVFVKDAVPVAGERP